MSDTVNITVYENTPEGMLAAMAATELRLNQKIDDALLDSDILGGVTTSSAVPAEGNIHAIGVGPGTYSNWGGMEIPVNNIGTLQRVNGVHSVSLTALDISSKVNVSDVINNLASTEIEKPLSAAQGNALDGKKANVTDIYNSVKSKNIFNKLTVVNGFYPDKDANGTLTALGGFISSDFIPCTELLTYKANYPFSFLCFYNSSKTFISGTAVADQYLINAPANAAFFRLDVYVLNSFQIELGTVSTYYVPYSETLVSKFENTENKITEWSAEPSKIKVPTEFLIKPKIDKLDAVFKESTKNRFNKLTVTMGAYPDKDANGTLTALGGFISSDFIPCIDTEMYHANYPFSFICFYNENKSFISGIGLGGQFDINPPTNAAFFRLDVQTINLFQVELGSSFTSYEPYKEITLKIPITPKYVDITVVPNAGAFNSIRETIANITDATEFRRYRVHVLNGRWFECDLVGKEWVEIIGQDQLLTVLYCDGLSPKIVPENYSFGQVGVALNTVPQYQKHCFNALNDLVVSNLTVEVNDAKYCVHLDGATYKNVNFKNCYFKTFANVNFCVGIGVYGYSSGGQDLRFTGCTFERTGVNEYGVLFHNFHNQQKPSSLLIENSYFKNCNYLVVDELGSEQDDRVELINCSSDKNARVEFMVDYGGDEKTLWINPATGLKEPNPQNVPYCIKLNISGTKVSEIHSVNFPFGNYGLARPLFLKTITGNSKPILEFSDNQSALNAGLKVDDKYRTGDLLKIVH